MLLPLLACGAPDPLDEETVDAGAPTAEPCGFTPAGLDAAGGFLSLDLAAAPFAWDPGTGTLLSEGLGYNGMVPGPVIELTRGDTFEARFTNGLPYDSTIHWHGLRVPDAMDGAARMMDMVPPGGEFTYTLPIQDAGFYWYHPHMATDMDLERGLYGTILVRQPGEAAPDCELPLVLDDVLLDDAGQIEPPDTGHMQLMGRLGNLLLANGRSDRRVEVPAGGTTLLRLVNAANARFWDLTLPGQAMEVVATDGGWLAEAVPVDHLVVAPGERAIVRVSFTGETGDEFRLTNARFPLHHDGADMSELDPMGDGENPVMTFVLGEEPESPAPWALPVPDVPALAGDAPLAHTWVLDEEMMDGIVTIDGYSYPDVPVVQVEGDLETRFEVRNDSEMHHPFHLHGNRFQVLDVEGVAPDFPGWKDTFDVPPESTVTIVGELDNPGEWMYHCHILEHAELGMAGLMIVE